MQWTPHDAGNARTIECLLRKAAAVEWSWLKRAAMCAGDGTSGEWGYSRRLENVTVSHRCRTLSFWVWVWSSLALFYFAMPHFLSFGRGGCLLYAIVYWNYINFIVKRLTWLLTWARCGGYNSRTQKAEAGDHSRPSKIYWVPPASPSFWWTTYPQKL